MTEGVTDQLKEFEKDLQDAAEREGLSLYTTLRYNAEDISVQAEDVGHSDLRVWLENHGATVVQAETGGYFCVRPDQSEDSRGESA